MIRPNIFRTASFRLAIAYAALFTISAAVLFAVVYVILSDFAAEQMRAAVEAEIATLADEARSDGIEHLSKLVSARLNGREDASHYLVVDQGGRKLAGDLPVSAAIRGWAQVADAPEADEDDGRPLLAKGVDIAGGGLLVVGHEADEQDELLEALIAAFAIAGALSIALALAVGLVMSRAFLRRVDSFSATANQIVQGRLDERVPLSGTGDEFDRLADSVNDMLARIQHLMEGVRQISSDIAHDLRTPLARLRQGLETARRKATDVAAFQRAVEQAIEETDEILATFAALLRIAEVEAGTRRAGFAAIDLSDMFETLAEAYAAVAEDSGRKLVASIEPRLSIRGDRELLIQMLSNLIENAIRHTPPRTLITVSLKKTRHAVVGSVADNGTGIPAPERERVLRRFHRLESSRSTPGSGLGLALVAAVAELHGIKLQMKDNDPGLSVELSFANGKA